MDKGVKYFEVINIVPSDSVFLGITNGMAVEVTKSRSLPF